MSWTIDYSHTEVNFKARHMMISNVRGNFEKFSGTVNFDELNPANTTVEIRVETGSINTNEEKRDAHLRSADFSDSEKYPLLIFKSTRVELVDKTHARLIGDLTIKDVTHPVSLDVEYLGSATAPWGAVNAGFSASTRISRKDWNINWNVALETGGWLVGDMIEISIELELTKVAEPILEAEA
jgi:polyisoprenoid-binding protein YceI